MRMKHVLLAGGTTVVLMLKENQEGHGIVHSASNKNKISLYKPPHFISLNSSLIYNLNLILFHFVCVCMCPFTPSLIILCTVNDILI